MTLRYDKPRTMNTTQPTAPEPTDAQKRLVTDLFWHFARDGENEGAHALIAASEAAAVERAERLCVYEVQEASAKQAIAEEALAAALAREAALRQICAKLVTDGNTITLAENLAKKTVECVNLRKALCPFAKFAKMHGVFALLCGLNGARIKSEEWRAAFDVYRD